jgi:DNA polymerase IV
MKLLCVLLAHFPLRCEIRRHPDLAETPVVLTSMKGSQKLVLDFSPELTDLQPEMPVQQALSRHGEVVLLQADIPYYRIVFNGILDLLEFKSPLVEDFDLGQAYVGLDGMQLIYPNDAVLIKAVKEVIPEGFPVRMGIAGGKFPAYLAALDSAPGGYKTLEGSSALYFKDLPCDVLPISLKSKTSLRSFGIRTLGQAAALPLGPLQSQFGPEGRMISNLAQGRDDTPLYPRYMEENIEESSALSSVTVSLEAILISVEALLSRVFSGDSLKGRGIRGLTLWTRGWNAGHWEHSISYKEPAMDIRSVISRVKYILENFAQPGPVEQVGIKITGLGYRSGQQKSLFSEVRARDRLMTDIKQLNFRLGGPQVFTLKEIEPWSRIPERRYILAPISL